jgi:hypothetical protein
MKTIPVQIGNAARLDETNHTSTASNSCDISAILGNKAFVSAAKILPIRESLAQAQRTTTGNPSETAEPSSGRDPELRRVYRGAAAPDLAEQAGRDASAALELIAPAVAICAKSKLDLVHVLAAYEPREIACSHPDGHERQTTPG